ncbi:hypothetical protein [Bradyrhizobium japonicum]|uniref:hypothetical protein n=1 Tax=Bradyrhizobium japonicum TaxID=375 RepID=UPI0020108EEB|nr:hypothetical protein [Bradyrhizobium japonicum]UQD95223.1 hypothetical protein JEY30_26750 [Bradyrhizobium japonicum]
MLWNKVTLAGYAAVVSTVAIFISAGSLIYTKRSYDLSVTKELREIQEKQPAIDLQISPRGASAATFGLSIINRSEINIVPLSMRVEHSFEAGDLYLSSHQQSLDKLSSTLDLQSLGPIAPKGSAKLKGILAGATDGKSDSLTPGLELHFTFRLRYGDHTDSIETIDIVRNILPAVSDRFHPTSEMFLSAIEGAQRKARQKELLYFLGQIGVAVVVISAALVFVLRRLRQAGSSKIEP